MDIVLIVFTLFIPLLYLLDKITKKYPIVLVLLYCPILIGIMKMVLHLRKLTLLVEYGYTYWIIFNIIISSICVYYMINKIY